MYVPIKRMVMMMRIFVFILLMGLVSAGLTTEWTGTRSQVDVGRVALVVGNSAYLHHDPLSNPVNDAERIAEVLRELGFEVIHAPNVTKTEFTHSIENFGARIGVSDVALFYYAGHGLQIKGNNYLIPVDARITDTEEVEREALNADKLFDTMRRGHAKLNLIILDACRDNPFRGLTAAKASFLRDLAPGLAPPRNAPTGTLIAYATDPGRVAADGSGRHSPYTRALLKHITQPGLRLDTLFKRVREHVIENTDGEQTPWENTSVVGDDFYFRPAAFIECKIDVADDEAYVYINDSPVAVSSGSREWQRVQLNPGENSLEIKVYNQKTRRGIIGPREGWSYVVRLRALGQEKVYQESEDNPPDDRWGQTFTRVKTIIKVDENTGWISIR
jgi:hypothetical protein